MVFELTYTSKQNTTIDLAENEDFILKDVDGLTGVDVNLSTVTIAMADGDDVTNTKTKPRPINLYFEIKPGVDPEQAKRRILAVIKPKGRGTLNFSYEGRNLEIQGVVETIKMPRFNNKVTMQVQFYCNYPYWQDAAAIIGQVSKILGLFHYKMTVTAANPIIFGQILGQATNIINNEGDVATGCLIHLIATGDGVINPKIERAIDGAYFQINATMNAGDEIIINTNKGQKSVVKNSVSIIDQVASGSTWFQLEVGENEFTVTDDSTGGNLKTNFEYKRSFV